MCTASGDAGRWFLLQHRLHLPKSITCGRFLDFDRIRPNAAHGGRIGPKLGRCEASSGLSSTSFGRSRAGSRPKPAKHRDVPTDYIMRSGENFVAARVVPAAPTRAQATV